MKHETTRTIICIFAGIFLAETVIQIIKHQLKEMASMFDVDFDFFEDWEDEDLC